ncbi:ephexin-1 isoform X2 [Acipenser ruthenus]|uniref:ephexin-1 isoform X2 n=1 Tax=Acipenser ruthenus TaxID=7906 RepID=UPI002741AA61|nr:ephexin-1 isoform X2 [Acipenser ruthenus]
MKYRDRDCKEDVMNSTSERNSDSSPCWRSPVPQKPALSPLLLGPTSAFKPGIKLNLNGEPTGLIPGGAHAALIQELSGMLQENRLSPRHSEPSRALSDSTVPMEALSQHISCCNIQKGRPPQGKQGEDLNDIDNISVRLLDGESLVGRQAEDQAVTATIGPPAEAWKNLIAQRTGVLYQEYGTQFCLQEIQRRRQCDAESDGEPAVRDPALPLQLCRDSPSSTMKLWQNREAVRSSGVLSVLSTEKRQHQEAMFELVTSETSYYKSLELLVTHFQENRQLIQSLSQSEAHFIFSNIRDVKDVSERFLLDLERRVEENVIISDVCDIVSWHASQHFHEFVTYVSNQTYQQRAYRRILKENESFREVMSGLEQAPQCKGLPFTSFLILPFQRITRLKLLVQNILKKVEEGSEEEASAVMAHKHLEKVVRDCNEGVRKMSRTEELISIEKTLEFKCKSVPVISHSRWLLKRGELQLMSGPKSTRTLRSRKLFQPLYLFLFNNLLLVTRRSSSLEKFYVLDSALRSMLRTEEQQDQGKALSNIFSLCLLENQEERTVNYMLKACSPSDKKRWISALTPNPRTKFLSAKTHQSDSPQVQCVHLYVSQEPDELSLDLADVLNVVEQTEDGWMLGERLHDREKGWFPCKVVEEIHNQELRAQNLRECHRIYRAQESRPRSNHRLGSRARHSRVAPS